MPGNGFVYLDWTGSADTALDLVDQLVDISGDGVVWTQLAVLDKETHFYLSEGLTNGSEYWFRVRVRDSSGNIAPGVSVGPLTPSETAVTDVSGSISADAVWLRVSIMSRATSRWTLVSP